MLDSTPHLSERNERVDSAVKSALDFTPDNFKIPYNNLKPKNQ